MICSHIFTSDSVLREFLNAFKKDKHVRENAVRLVQSYKKRRDVTIIHECSDDFDRGLEIFNTYSDKEFSHTDCVSFHIMEEHCLKDALTYDKDFIQKGFRALMRLV